MRAQWENSEESQEQEQIRRNNILEITREQLEEVISIMIPTISANSKPVTTPVNTANEPERENATLK